MARYVEQVWVDEIYDPVTGETISEGTPYTAKRANHIEEGIGDLSESQEEQDRRLDRLELKIALLDRSSSNNVFFDTLDGKPANKLTLETAITDILAPAAIGATAIGVENVTDFKVGTEVTIFDNVNQENAMITAINTTSKTITLSALTKAYKKGAQIARSNVVIDTVNQKMKTGDWGTYTVTVSEVS